MMTLEERLRRLTSSVQPSRQASGQGHSRDSDTCPLCGGDEWILDRETNTAVPCRCREKAIMQRRLTFADVPEAYRDMRLGTFRTDVYRQEDSRRRIDIACRSVKCYLENFTEMHGNGMGLYLFSKTKGSGKTRMAASLANELLKDHAVKFAVSTTIIREIKGTWDKDSPSSESSLLNALGTVDILVIDDFGTEKAAGWINDRFYQIINDRYIHRLVTIFTSNEELERLDYDDRITNRIKERTFQIHFPDESIRDHMAQDNMRRMLGEIAGR